MIDAHNHLQDRRLDGVRHSFLHRAPGLGIEAAVVNGTSESDWNVVALLAGGHAWILPSIGLHPWHAGRRTPGWEARFIAALERTGGAVGEIGLDGWIPGADLEDQEQVFAAQWRAACERNLPVTVHCLKAWGRLESFLRREGSPPGFLLHAYGGPAEMVPFFVRKGAFFSLSAWFAHPRKARNREVFRIIPPERLLVETDAPDMLPPEAWRAEPASDPDTGAPVQHPADLRSGYRLAAEVTGMTPEELERLTRSNFARLFGPVRGGAPEAPPPKHPGDQ